MANDVEKRVCENREILDGRLCCKYNDRTCSNISLVSITANRTIHYLCNYEKKDCDHPHHSDEI